MTNELKRIIRLWLTDMRWFSQLVVRRKLRAYQLEPARAILRSVLLGHGQEFALLFPRQSGKNELAAQVTAYLLNLLQGRPGAQIVLAAPTFVPQALNAMRRLEAVLSNPWNRSRWRRRDGRVVQLGQASALFLSAGPRANVVGATASTLLLIDEAQHVPESLFYERFAPMAASANTTVVYLGTAWTSRTLLARTIEQLRAQERRDGVRRVFQVSPEQVAAENPAYADHVRKQVEKLGRTHPLVKTQYFNETIDDEGGMFPPERRALMHGDHPRRRAPAPGGLYALLLDVAGEDEGAAGGSLLANPRRDATALTVVEIDAATLSDPVFHAPTYRVVDRREWVGVKHTALYGQLVALARHWQARRLVVDATGVGAGLASFLAGALGEEVVIGYEFNGPSKSRLGWQFLAVVDTGRFRDYDRRPLSADDSQQPIASGLVKPESLPVDVEQARFEQQLEFCQYEIAPGRGHSMHWGVPDGTRDPVTGELVHDDLLLSAALCAVLDEQEWHSASPALIVRARDPLAEMERGF